MKKLINSILIIIGLVLTVPVIAQDKNRTIAGLVIDKNNIPIPGVVVLAKGTTIAVATNEKGTFEITFSDKVSELEFSLLGYDTEIVKLTDKAGITVELRERDTALDEVVVVGYGTVAKKDLTGAVGKVNVDDLIKAPVGSFAEALAGRVAGVQVSSSDGQPGSAPQIIIRGASSLTQNNSPLYVVDRIPIEDFDPTSVSTEDIESMYILKDASAIAIYGARAANGVIVITTKKGMSSTPVVDLKMRIGFPRITKKIDMMSSYEYVKYLNEFDPGRAQMLYFNDGMTLDSYKNVESVNWQDHITSNNPVTQIYDLSVSGGNDQTKYMVSGSFYSQDGVLDNSGSSSYRGRATLQQKIRSNMELGVNVAASQHDSYGQLVSSDGVNTTTLTNLLYRVWAYRPYSPNGNLLEEFVDDDLYSSNDFRINPILSNENEYRKSTRRDLNASVSFEYKPINKLTLFMTGAINILNRESKQFNNSLTIEGSPYNIRNTKGQWGSIDNYSRNIYTNENTLTYNDLINDVHRINAIAGFSLEKGTTQSHGYTAVNIPNEDLGINGLGKGVPYSNHYTAGDYALVSYYGRLNYTYDSKYLLTATLRGDGSSKFAPGNRWGYFPSAALAWNVAEEDFIKNIYEISSLKLRGSYGIIGNNRIGYYNYLASLATGIGNYYSYGGDTPSVGVGTDKLANPDLTWERTKQLDLGLEISLFNGRIRLEADYYNKRTDDLLLNSQIPSNSGYTYAMQNVGEIENQGVELTIETVNLTKNNFTWTSSFNISFNKNKVLQLNNNAPNRLDFPRFQTTYNNTPLYITEVGRPMGMFYGLVFDGIYQYDDFMEGTENRYVLKQGVSDNGGPVSPGDIKYKDMNGDGTINDFDRVVLGNPHPLHTGGFSNNFRYDSKKYGQFDLGIFLQWSYGNDVFNANRIIFEGNGIAATGINQYASYEDRWTPTNPSNKMFKTKGAGPQGFISDRTLEDGSFLRLKTLEFSYTLPQRLLRSHNSMFRSISFNVTAQNLFTITGYEGMDPEVSVMNNVLTPGFDFCAYPRAKVITFGCRLRF